MLSVHKTIHYLNSCPDYWVVNIISQIPQACSDRDSSWWSRSVVAFVCCPLPVVRAQSSYLCQDINTYKLWILHNQVVEEVAKRWIMALLGMAIDFFGPASFVVVEDNDNIIRQKTVSRIAFTNAIYDLNVCGSAGSLVFWLHRAWTLTVTCMTSWHATQAKLSWVHKEDWTILFCLQSVVIETSEVMSSAEEKSVDDLLRRSQESRARLQALEKGAKLPWLVRLKRHFTKQGAGITNVVMAGAVFAVAWGKFMQKAEHEVRSTYLRMALNVFWCEMWFCRVKDILQSVVYIFWLWQLGGSLM